MPTQSAATTTPGRTETKRGEFQLALLAASAGGIPALQDFLSKLPRNFPIPIAVVLHRAQSRAPVLANILAKRCPLAVKVAEQGETFRAGTVYLAPARQHLVVRAKCLEPALGLPLEVLEGAAGRRPSGHDPPPVAPAVR